MRSIVIRVHPSLVPALEIIRKQSADEIKKLYNLDEVEIFDTFASQILASKILNGNGVKIKINKSGKNKASIKLNGL